MLALPTVDLARRPDTTELLPFDEYDRILVSFSGGKDSIALVLDLFERGVDPSRIELWHQCIDGDPAAGDHFFDWPVTESYVRAFARAFGLRLKFQWRHGGFRGELLKENDRSKPVSFERDDGTIGTAGGVKGSITTRRMFPQQTADLSVRWCSAALKIDTFALAVNNEPAFKGAKLLVLTGERRAESAARSRYAEKEKHRCSTKSRRVDGWRSVIDWTDESVWGIMERHRVVPHPGYRLGFGRLSCMKCIFIGPDEWATNYLLDPAGTAEVERLEGVFEKTIRRGQTIRQQADRGKPFQNAYEADLARLAMSRDYPADGIILPPGASWELPAGAFKGGGCGPT